MKMKAACYYSICLCFVLMTTQQVVSGEMEDKSEEDARSDSKLENGTRLIQVNNNNETSAEEGPPDSHEAMNNRDISIRRDKRSYHFLMGLIRNNSGKYDVVTDSASTTSLPEISPGELGASELLLELLVKIASNPETWEKVHKLLGESCCKVHIVVKETFPIEKIDGDLVASKKIIESLSAENSIINLDKKDRAKLKNNTKWLQRTSTTEQTTSLPTTTSRYKSFLKNIVLQRVTGKPFHINKTPKAYIALSVIAPKPVTNRYQEDDLTLERELRQLKPWSHSQNLKNMADIRSKWIIQNDQNNDKK